MAPKLNFKIHHGPQIDIEADGPFRVLLVIGWREDTDTDRQMTTVDTYLLIPTNPPRLICDCPSRITFDWIDEELLSGIVNNAMTIARDCVRSILAKSPLFPREVRDRFPDLFPYEFVDIMEINDLCRYYGNAGSVMREQFHFIERNTRCEELRDCLARLRKNTH